PVSESASSSGQKRERVAETPQPVGLVGSSTGRARKQRIHPGESTGSRRGGRHPSSSGRSPGGRRRPALPDGRTALYRAAGGPEFLNPRRLAEDYRAAHNDSSLLITFPTKHCPGLAREGRQQLLTIVLCSHVVLTPAHDLLTLGAQRTRRDLASSCVRIHSSDSASTNAFAP